MGATASRLQRGVAHGGARDRESEAGGIHQCHTSYCVCERHACADGRNQLLVRSQEAAIKALGTSAD